MTGQPLRVCYFGAYRQEYSRNRIMIAGLRSAGCTVVECHVPLWSGIEDRVQAATGGWRRPGFWLRAARVYSQLIRKHASLDYDVMVVGYPGQFDVFLARWLSRRRGAPLAWDVFMSIYLIAVERGLDRRSPFTVNMLRRIESAALRQPDLLIQDTPAYVEWLHTMYHVPLDKFRLAPTGADDRLFTPGPAPARPASAPFQALYYGSYIPNHGVPAILDAARLLAADPAIAFTLIGDGPERAAAEAQAGQWALPNIAFLDWLPPERLVERLRAADVCLGAFGETPQSLMTVQNKIYEALAVGRAVISGDSPAVRHALKDGEEILLIPRLDATALAAAIQRLRADPTLLAHLAAQGRAAFASRYSIAAIGQITAGYLRALVENRPPAPPR